MRKTISRTAILATGVAVVTTVGVASAAWTIAGTSSQTDNGKSTHVLSLSVTATLPQDVYPTDAFSQDLAITNTNPFNANLTSVQVANYSSSTAACQTAISALTATQQSGLVSVASNFANNATSVTIAKRQGQTNGTGTYPTTVTVSNDLPNACQDSNLTVNFTVGGASA